MAVSCIEPRAHYQPNFVYSGPIELVVWSIPALTVILLGGVAWIGSHQLDPAGYTVVSKATKEFIDASGRRKIKGNMHVELAVDAMELTEHVDEIVLFYGHGDFRSLVQAVQRRGVRVTVVSTISRQPPIR